MQTHKTIITLALLISSLPLFAQDTGTNAAPQIPEEARKHFVMGTALFKDAKTQDDYTQVVGEFKQAADLAPQWPDARYNLGLAKEAAGDYSGAEADLKLYQQFKLSDDEARAAQDKVYFIEAKEGKRKSMCQFFYGMNTDEGKHQDGKDWRFKSSSTADWAKGSGAATIYCSTDRDNHPTVQITIYFHSLVGPQYIGLTGTIKGDDFNSIEWKQDREHKPIVTIDQADSHIKCENIFVSCPDSQGNTQRASVTFEISANNN